MGEALANAMLDHGGANRTYVIAAPQAYTFDDVAAALTEASGTTVDYTQITDEEYVASVVEAGFPEPLARRFLGFCSDIRNDQLDETSTDLETLLGRRAASLPEGLREVFAL
jgi:NAD(P)H dehydrogenase (quinone)